jgi:hypothetical protein
MTNYPNNTFQRAAQMLAAAADVLEQGQAINRVSIVVTSIALGTLLLSLAPASPGAQPTAAIVVALGLIELFLAARVAIAALRFRRLAEDAAAERLDLAAFDAALIALQLTTAKQAGRPVGRRFQLARRLLLAQAGVLLLQAIVAVAGAFLIYFVGF